MTDAGIRFQVEVPGGVVSAIRHAPSGAAANRLLIYAPGAGSSLTDPFGVHLSAQLPPHGIEVWRFQFPYSEAGRSIPDRTPVLEATWRAVLEAARRDGVSIVVSGRSMGGRMASHVVAQGAEVAGLALFAYPLHPPGQPDKLRTAHLPSIQVPTLFCSGTRDTFGTPQELTEAAALVPHHRLHWLEGADHGFAVLKASGQTREQVWQDALNALLTFWDSIET